MYNNLLCLVIISKYSKFHVVIFKTFIKDLHDNNHNQKRACLFLQKGQVNDLLFSA